MDTVMKRNVYLQKIHFYYIPSSEILEFPSVINFDIITSDDINFHSLPAVNLGTTFFIKHLES